MSGDDTRNRITDPDTLRSFEDRSRRAAADAMREITPDITDEEVAQRVAAGDASVIWVKARITTGSASTPEELAALRRHLPGGANRGGRPRGTNAVDDAGGDATIHAIVDELRRNHRRVTLKAIAAASGAFTRDNLRRWLLENGKGIADY